MDNDERLNLIVGVAGSVIALVGFIGLFVSVIVSMQPTELERVCRNKNIYLVDGKFYQCIEVKPVAQGVNKNEQ